MKFRILLLAFLPFACSSAEDGKALYETFCSACHGVDGVGPEGTLNPPLAKSEWLLGSPDRAISVGKPENVARIRAKLIDRKEAYRSAELLKEHPIPYRQGWPRLENLTSHVYAGKWAVMPDFSQMEAVSVEEEPRNLVDSAHGNRDQEFAVVWEGDHVTAEEGDYAAVLAHGQYYKTEPIPMPTATLGRCSVSPARPTRNPTGAAGS